jgi:3-hydroxyacyl-[acyl-carrier-protein] dehydratase
MRFFLVDRVHELRPGELARGVKNLSLTEDLFQDHFPEHPVFPGTLLIEALAQLSGFLAECSFHQGSSETRRAVLAQIDKAKLHLPCRPGDQIELVARLASQLEGATQLEAEALVRGERAASATLTFRLLKVESDKLHEQRRALYQLWTRDLNLPFAIR